MSTAPPVRVASNGLQRDNTEIKIVSHSNLFYWWPVWLVGFILAILTWAEGHTMVIVPKGTIAKVITLEGQQKEAYFLPDSKQHFHAGDNNPRILVSAHKGFGVLYAIVLLLVILITNVPLRGLWSFIVLGAILSLSIIFATLGWWDEILTRIAQLHIYINFAGYFLISTALLLIWLVTFFFFDPQVYMIFTPGQLRVRQEIGGGEKVYDTMGMHFEKQRNDLFRHWILGLGSGDLIVKTSGSNSEHFPLPNVLFVGKKVQQMEEMLREKPVVAG